MRQDGTEIAVGGGPAVDPEDAKAALTEPPLFGSDIRVPYEFGVDYRGAWEDVSYGVQISVRRHAAALASMGMPVWLVSHGHRMMHLDARTGERYQGFADHQAISPDVLAEVRPLLDRKHRQSLARIEHRILDPSSIANVVYPPRARDPEHRRRANATTILYTVLERARPDDDTRQCAALASALAEVWVPCRQNKDILVQSGLAPERVAVVPHPIPTGDPVLAARRRLRHDGLVRFANIGKWEPRKAQHELLGGFLLAFKAHEQRELVLKYSPFGSKWAEYPEDPVESVKAWLADERVKQNGWTAANVDARIRLFPQYLPRKAIVQMLSETDVYVSAGRAEGFDLPALDACILGLRLIVMGFGGATDLCLPEDVAGPQRTLAPSHPGYNWHGAKWSGHTAEDVAQELAKAAHCVIENTTQRAPLNPRAFSMEVIGNIMLNRILDLCRANRSPYVFEPIKEYVDAFAG